MGKGQKKKTINTWITWLHALSMLWWLCEIPNHDRPRFIGTIHDDDDDNVKSRNDIQLNIHHIWHHCDLYPSVVDLLVDLYTSLTVLNISTPWIFDWGHFKGRKVPTATIHFHLLSEREYWNVTSNLFCSSLVAYKDSLNFTDTREKNETRCDNWKDLWKQM